jgi:tetratricopeptide (TPR) repeat protein
VFSLGVTLMEMFDRTRPAPDTPAASLTGRFGWLGGATRSNLADVIGACLRSSPAGRPNSIATIETAITEAFREATGVPIEPPPAGSWETGPDLGQRAYALFMLGRTDEATKLQADLFSKYARQESEGPAESGPREPVTMMDYNEKGWRFIVPEKHVTEAESKLASDPDNLDLLHHAANTNHMAGRLDRALSHYSRLLELEPNKIEWLENVCHILEEQEQWTAALACHDRIVRLSPQDANHWLNRAECWEKFGDLGKAAESAAKAVAADPRSENARNTYGHYLEKLGDYRGALTQFEAVLEANPESALTLYNVGTCWNKLGRPDLAFKNLLTAVEKDSGFAVALNTLGALSLQVRSFQEALIFLERAIAADPHYSRPWFNKGQVYKAMEKFENAREAYLAALEIDPNYELAKEALEQLESGQV